MNTCDCGNSLEPSTGGISLPGGDYICVKCVTRRCDSWPDLLSALKVAVLIIGKHYHTTETMDLLSGMKNTIAKSEGKQ